MGIMNWSWRMGRIFGITVRLHLFLFIFLAVELLQWISSSGFILGLTWFTLLSGALFGIILLHEFGHCFAARSVGGRADEVMLWPLGGLAYVHAPNTPRAQMKTAIGGPAVNVGIGIVLGLFLLVFQVPLELRFDSWHIISQSGTLYWIQFWLEHVFKLNLILLLFNLLPAFPMDGGRMLQCYLWPKLGFAEATLKAIFFGNLCAIGLAVIGVFGENFLLIFIALFIYTQGAQMKILIQEGALQDESVFGYDFSGGYSTLEESSPAEMPKKPGLLERWSTKRKEDKLKREKEEWDQINRRVDELLGKVSEHGLHSLTEPERQFLRNASKRYKR